MQLHFIKCRQKLLIYLTKNNVGLHHVCGHTAKVHVFWGDLAVGMEWLPFSKAVSTALMASIILPGVLGERTAVVQATACDSGKEASSFSPWGNWTSDLGLISTMFWPTMLIGHTWQKFGDMEKMSEHRILDFNVFVLIWWKKNP